MSLSRVPYCLPHLLKHLTQSFLITTSRPSLFPKLQLWILHHQDYTIHSLLLGAFIPVSQVTPLLPYLSAHSDSTPSHDLSVVRPLHCSHSSTSMICPPPCLSHTLSPYPLVLSNSCKYSSNLLYTIPLSYYELLTFPFILHNIPNSIDPTVSFLPSLLRFNSMVSHYKVTPSTPLSFSSISLTNHNPD